MSPRPRSAAIARARPSSCYSSTTSFRLLKPKARVIDLGGRAGRLDAGVGRAHEGGVVIGIDLTPVGPIAGATVLAKDFYDEDAPAMLTKLLDGPADVVLSDMAAAATGETQSTTFVIMGLAGSRARLRPLGPESRAALSSPRCWRGGTERPLLARLKKDFEEKSAT